MVLITDFSLMSLEERPIGEQAGSHQDGWQGSETLKSDIRAQDAARSLHEKGSHWLPFHNG
ncbi:hypothetical protein CF132_04760 [Aeromonas dhakensis]|nr:hypothetical protein CF132_04760 [Aeromonas dhakensis]